MTTTNKPQPRQTKAKVEQPKPRNPAELMIDERFMRPEDAQRFRTAKTDGEKHDALDAITAYAVTSPETRSAGVMQKYDGNTLNLMAAIGELSDQNAKVKAGDMSRPEAILLSQAHALDALFSNLARRAHDNMGQGHYLHAAEVYLKLALRAQSQCRTTLETLSAIKNPPVVFARQMNVSNGPQQVNNGVAATAPQPVAKEATQAQQIESATNKLSGESYELLPDTRASQAARRIDTPVEALGEIHRAEDGGR